MKLVYTITLISAVLTGAIYLFTSRNQQKLSLVNSQDTLTQFQLWKLNNQVRFSNNQEEQYRFQVFQDNLEFIEQNNRENNGLTLGANQFAHMTNKEFQDQHVQQEAQTDNKHKILGNQSVSFNSTVDWVQGGQVTNVKNQGRCASSYAFNAAESYESIAVAKGKNLTSLSAQQFVSCTNTTVNGCNSNQTFMDSWDYACGVGIQTAQNYPYQNQNTNSSLSCKQKSTAGYIEGSCFATGPIPNTQYTVNNTLNSLGFQVGSAGIDARSRYFQHYAGGILKYNQCQSGVNNYWVTLVGYNTTASTRYFTIKNSMGVTWGNRGYAQVEMANTLTNGTCGLYLNIQFAGI